MPRCASGASERCTGGSASSRGGYRDPGRGFQRAPARSLLGVTLGLSAAALALSASVPAIRSTPTRAAGFVLALAAAATLAHLLAGFLAVRAQRARPGGVFSVARRVATLGFVLDVASLVVAGLWIGCQTPGTGGCGRGSADLCRAVPGLGSSAWLAVRRAASGRCYRAHPGASHAAARATGCDAAPLLDRGFGAVSLRQRCLASRFAALQDSLPRFALAISSPRASGKSRARPALALSALVAALTSVEQRRAPPSLRAREALLRSPVRRENDAARAGVWKQRALREDGIRGRSTLGFAYLYRDVRARRCSRRLRPQFFALPAGAALAGAAPLDLARPSSRVILAAAAAACGLGSGPTAQRFDRPQRRRDRRNRTDPQYAGYYRKGPRWWSPRAWSRGRPVHGARAPMGRCSRQAQRHCCWPTTRRSRSRSPATSCTAR
jgi:hypothetical protein